MVNTGNITQVAIPLKSDSPEVSVNIFTYTNKDLTDDLLQLTGTFGRFIRFEISILNVKTELAVATFSRVFMYVQNLANNDINPLSSANTGDIPNVIGSIGTTPRGLCNLQINKFEIVPTANLVLSSENLRLDYMDEFFERTLTYLQAAIEEDLNP